MREGSPHGPLVRLGAGKVWHRVQELAGRARRRLPLRYPDRDAGSLSKDIKTPLTTSSKTQPASSTPFTSSSSPVTLSMRYVVASSKTRPVAAGARVIPSTKSGFSCAPRVIGSRSVNKNDSVRPSWRMRRISVSKLPTTAPSKCAMSSIKPHPPKADAWPLVSSRAYQPVLSLKSLA